MKSEKKKERKKKLFKNRLRHDVATLTKNELLLHKLVFSKVSANSQSTVVPNG